MARRLVEEDRGALEDSEASDSTSAVVRALARLGSTDEAEALQAAGDLWAGLCHQHGYVSSAALPALPFLLEMLDRGSDVLRVELLDILLGLARCSHPTDFPPSPAWIQELRAQLLAERPRLERLAKHPDEAVADLPGWCSTCWRLPR